MSNTLLLKTILLGFVVLLSAIASAKGDYSGREDVQAFANEFAKTHSKNADEILQILAHGKKQQTILDAISRPAERVLTWGDYRKIFVEPKRLDQGIEFWREHRELIADVSKKYQVAPEIIVAIIGVETRFGRVAGNYKVLDALLTLGFDYPPRAKFFRGQLEHFLLMTDEQKLDATKLKGSYAGAMGYGQFIPGSYRAYAVDYDGDGIADIWKNPADAVASVGNYFSKHHWKAGDLVAVQLTQAITDEKLISEKLKPATTISALRKARVQVPKELDGATKVTVMELETERGKEYWLGFQNFYVITRYNHSHMYALSTYQLSQLIKAHLDID